jgi:hypothetical protein
VLDMLRAIRSIAVKASVLIALAFISMECCRGASESFDVVVYGRNRKRDYGGGWGGSGRHARCVGRAGQACGGMVSGGLSNSHVDNQQQLVGGLARQFFANAGDHYHQPVAWAFEPHVAETILRGMLNNAHVSTFFDCRRTAVKKSDSRLTLIRMENGHEFSARIFIDSSCEGDLMKLAGVSYVVGREGRAQYGESLAGRQDLLPGHHQFKFAVSADAPEGGLLPLVVPQDKVGQIGEADGRFQSYCFRLCLRRTHWTGFRSSGRRAMIRHDTQSRGGSAPQ